MSSDLVKSDPKFPNALVPDARELPEVFKAWNTAGLEPREVAVEDVVQQIVIKHYPLKENEKNTLGQLEWSVSRADGMQAMGLMMTAMHSMFMKFFKTRPRPRLTSGRAQIMISLDDNKFAAAFSPTHDQVVLAGVVAAALWEVIENLKGDLSPDDVWSVVFGVDT